jgi:Na+-translocating ferredoxin:NAD+ oxidoreductase subunit C
MELALHTFRRGGVHPDTHKDLTARMSIEPIATPAEVWLPLSQHLGEPATPIVKKGDAVVRGQKIAEGGATGVPLHATISGKVKPLDKRPHPTLVNAQAIIITASAEQSELEFPEDPDWRTLAADEQLARIKEAGIVGLGGAAFPTWRKLVLPPNVKVDTLVINGAECEPYLTSDFQTMLAYPEQVVEGALVMARLVGVRRVLLGIEADKQAAMPGLIAAALPSRREGYDFEIVPCEVRYPQGAERNLIESLTGRIIPARALPYAVGVVVQNVATAVAVYDAVRFRRPLLDRIITVTGPGILQPRNLRVPIGTLLSHVVAACGGMREDTTRLIAGGPMMGRALPRLDLPVIKGLNGLVLLTGHGPLEDGYDPCISCGRCVEACPLGLEPDQVSIRVEAGRTLDTDRFGPLDCYECGSCSYVCPSGGPLMQFMQVSKAALRRAGELRIAT